MNAPDTALNRLLTRAPRMSASGWALFAGWGVIVGGYCLLALTAPSGRGLTAFGDIFQCLAALFACVGLMMNSSLPERRTRLFWLLLALGCAVSAKVEHAHIVSMGYESAGPPAGRILYFREGGRRYLKGPTSAREGRCVDAGLRLRNQERDACEGSRGTLER